MNSIKLFLVIFFSALITSCGSGSSGGGSSTTASTIIKGTAAAGAPIVGYISVYDSSTNTQPVKTNIPIDANGQYSVDVSGLTAPFTFHAVGYVGGTAVSYYSAATSADVGGTINITPFTDLIIRNIAATLVDMYINSGGFSGLTATQLNAQRIALTAQLAPALAAMGLSGSMDLLRASFNADGTGLDRFMLAVKVNTTSSTATITNIMNAANTLVINTNTGALTGTLGTSGLASSGTALDGMLATTNAFSALFATSLPSLTDPTLTGLFTSSFMAGGQNLTAFLNQVTSQQNLIGMKYNNFVVDSIDSLGTTAQVHFVPVNAGVNLAPSNPGGALGWQMKKNAVSGTWQFDGDQRIAQVSVKTTANKFACNPADIPTCTTATTYITGLILEVNNPGGQAIGSALILGPGLPAGGVAYTASAVGQPLSRTTVNPNPCLGCPEWAMSDNDINGVTTGIIAITPNSTYSVTLYGSLNQTGTPLATYTEVVPVPPVLNTALPTLAFPSITGSSMVNLAGLSGATLTPSWTIPPGLWGHYLSVYMQQSGTNAAQSVMKYDMLTSSGTSSLDITAPATGTWTNGSYTISARDQYAGKLVVNYQ